MLSDREPWFRVCEILSQQENLKVTITQSVRAGCITGGSAFGGALLAGPIGIAIGAALGGIYAACSSHNFKPVIKILSEDLTPRQKQQLSEAVSRIASNVNAADAAMLLSMVLTNQSLKATIIREIGNFLLRELNVRLT